MSPPNEKEMPPPAQEERQMPKRFDFEQFEGVEDIEIDNLDEILECGDDLMDIEQTAFMGSSKIMLKMILQLI